MGLRWPQRRQQSGVTLRPPIKGRIPPINGSTPGLPYHWNLLERQKPGIPLINGIATLKTALITWSVWPWKDRRAESHEPHSPSVPWVHAIGARGRGAPPCWIPQRSRRAAEAKSRNGPPKYLPENDRSSFILPFPPGASSFQWLSLRRLWGAHASRASRVLNFARA
jgi:hypothetical protein